MPKDFPKEFEVFHPSRVPDERELVKLKLRKLVLYGYLIIIPITGLLISVPYITAMNPGQLIAFAIAIPLMLLFATTLLFVHVNREYGERLNYYVTYHASKVVMEHLPQRPHQILTPKPSLSEAFVTVMKVSEFAISFPSAPTLYIYYYDGGVWSTVKKFLGYPVPFFGLRIRTWAHLTTHATGRISLPDAQTEGNIAPEFVSTVKGLNFGELGLLTGGANPSKLDLLDGFMVTNLAMQVGSQENVGAAITKVLELHNALKEKGLIS